MNYVRPNVIVEGHAEEVFVRETLAKHLIQFGVVVQVRRVMTGRDHRKTYRGGLLKYQRARMDAMSWIKEEKHSNSVYFSTMFDYYALPNDFPDFAASQKKSSPYDAVAVLEAGMKNDIGSHRFIAYIQLHEFEALLLANPQNFLVDFYEVNDAISSLEATVQAFNNNPELVNDGPATAPSKRIISLIPEYKHNKVTVGAALAGFDGLPFLKSRCRHFGEWVTQLEYLGLNAKSLKQSHTL